ncbi:type II toxin-antitoxin system RelE/ParE family toxin [Patescibacteria group bacterium]|nr:type II toxin-antitoxin system RelE/ParE family toxin [Patescibacteria group bacterium]MBU2219493.1 type II toxin-antitoxin system RelE/ParE family toxin [Patescibacteria group bacterium]MBU2263081.1 type II toxin-antitoxin system RelE/ParE family toxin [Patescibacteria group bacterium]
MDYYFKESAFKEFKKFPKNIQRRILQKLDFYVSFSDPLDFSEPLIDKRFGEYRFRIGDWRVFFDLEKDKIIILDISHRKNAYR